MAETVKVINDAAMQALGSYRGGTKLFRGLGTRLGSATVVHSVVERRRLRSTAAAARVAGEAAAHEDDLDARTAGRRAPRDPPAGSGLRREPVHLLREDRREWFLSCCVPETSSASRHRTTAA
jgi:hypothetical protein